MTLIPKHPEWAGRAHRLTRALHDREPTEVTSILAELPTGAASDVHRLDRAQKLRRLIAVTEGLRVCQAPFTAPALEALRGRHGFGSGTYRSDVPVMPPVDGTWLNRVLDLNKRFVSASFAVTVAGAALAATDSLNAVVALHGARLGAEQSEILVQLGLQPLEDVVNFRARVASDINRNPEAQKAMNLAVASVVAEERDSVRIFVANVAGSAVGPLQVKPYLLDVSVRMFAAALPPGDQGEVRRALATPVLDSRFSHGYPGMSLGLLHRFLLDPDSGRYDTRWFQLSGNRPRRVCDLSEAVWEQPVEFRDKFYRLRDLTFAGLDWQYGCPAMPDGSAKNLSTLWWQYINRGLRSEFEGRSSPPVVEAC